MDYITKPIKPAVVLSRVQVHIEVKQARDRHQAGERRPEAIDPR